jgi:hypothetical protein
MEDLLRSGRPLAELWSVARGQVRYSDYRQQHIVAPAAAVEAPMRSATPEAPTPAAPTAPPPAAPAAPAIAPVKIPDDLVNVKAYLLWEQAGKPWGELRGDQHVRLTKTDC